MAFGQGLGHRSRIPWVVLLCLVWLGACLPATTPPQPTSGPPPSKELGRAVLQEALLHYRFVRDPEVLRAVRDQGRRLVEAVGANPATYHFLVVREDEPNAFALPGGYIFVFDGLLMEIRTSAELAGVLAHEIAHVERNHFFKDEKKITALDIATLAAILLGGGSPASVMIAGATNINLRLQFSRENESEADTYALRILRQAGEDPHGLVDFFQVLLQHERFHPQAVPPYLSTHPAVPQRLRRLETMLRSIPRRPEEEDPLAWRRIQALLLVQARPWQDPAPYLQALRLKALPEARQAEARAYFLGLFHFHRGRMQAAIQAYQEALSLHPRTAQYAEDLSLVYLRIQDLPKAATWARRALEWDPQRPIAHRILGMIALHQEKEEEALGHLLEAFRLWPEDPATNFHLSQVYQNQGNPERAAYYSARYLRLQLEIRKALQEYHRALALAPEGSPLAYQIQVELEDLLREGI